MTPRRKKKGNKEETTQEKGKQKKGKTNKEKRVWNPKRKTKTKENHQKAEDTKTAPF